MYDIIVTGVNALGSYNQESFKIAETGVISLYHIPEQKANASMHLSSY